MDLINTRLPTEILERILDLAHEEWSRSAPILLVCHKWLTIAEPIVWREFKLQIEHVVAAECELISKLNRYPRFRQYIQELNIFLTTPSPRLFSGTFEVLQYVGDKWGPLHAPLELTEAVFLNEIAALPFLRKLDLSGFRARERLKKCPLTKTVPMSRVGQKGDLRILQISDSDLIPDLVQYLLCIPLTLEMFASHDLKCISCSNQACIPDFLQSLLYTHCKTLRKVSIDALPYQPRLLDFSSLLRLQHLSIAARDLCAETTDQACRKLSAPALHRLVIDFDLCQGQHDEKLSATILHRDKGHSWLEKFMTAMVSEVPCSKLEFIHLIYHPTLDGDIPWQCDLVHSWVEDCSWPWDLIHDAARSAAKLGISLTHNKPWILKESRRSNRQSSLECVILAPGREDHYRRR